MTNIIHPESLATTRPKERGSALVVALMCLMALFAITFAATKIRVASARDVEDTNTQANQYWQARSGAATIQASLITDIPAVFDAEMLRAQIAVAGYPLPAFDPPSIAANLSRPVLNADGSITNSNASDCTSLLGNVNTWAARKSVIAENYAREHGYGSDKTRVAVFQESLRQQLVGAAANAEPAYILEYQIDSAVGEQGNARGRVRPSGTVMLGPAQPGCNTTVSLSANPSNIVVGSSSSLTVTYTNANHIWITDQTGGTVAGTNTTGLTETNASQTLNFNVSPLDNTTYRAHAEGSGCRAVSAESNVIVNYPPPEVIQFSANPSCINRGQSATLAFQVRYATSIAIVGSNFVQTFPGNSGTTITTGSMVVSPTTDSTYTLTATGPGGTTTATTSITVKQQFSIDQFESSSYCVIPGSSVNLSWASTNAETATITDSTTGLSIPVASSGNRSFAVNSTTTFTLTITRTGCSGVETLTRQVTVNTTPSPTATFAANPSDIELGNNTTLQWTTTDASTVTITPSPVAGSGMAGPQTVSGSGSLTIRPTAINQSPGYTYTLRATSDGCSPQTITKTALVIVRPVPAPPACPNVISFTADSCVLSGDSSTLRWNVADSDFVTVSGPGVSQTFSSNPIGTGSLVVNPTADSTYTITATRSGSCTAALPPFPTTASVNVRIKQPPTVTNFSASPALIDAGQTSRLTWNESANIGTVQITAIGGDTNTYTVPPGQRFLDVRPTSTATYTITVTSNDCAAQMATQSVTVTVASCPTINSYTATTSSIIAGGSSTLQWSTSNAAQVLLNGTPVSTSGSLTVTPNTTTTYRLTAISSNGSCNVEQTITVTVAGCPAPQINTFSSNPSTVLGGGNQMVRLAWSITDNSGTGITLSISPGIGTFTITNGFVDISQPQANTLYTLTVTNGCGVSATSQVAVTVASCSAFSDPLPPSQIPTGPEILYLRGRQYVTPCVNDPVFGNSCAFVDTSAAEFAWDTKNADNVTINGIPVPTQGVTSEFVPFVGIRPGTFSAHPTADTVFRMEAWNSSNPANRAAMEVLIKFVPPVAAGEGPPVITISNDGVNRTPGTPVSIPYDAFVLDSSFDAVRSGVSVDIEGVTSGLPAQGTATITAPSKTTDYKFIATYQGRQSIKYVTIIVEDPNNTGPGWQGTGMVPIPSIVSLPAPASVRMRMLSNGAIHIRYILSGSLTGIGGGADPMSGGSVPTPFGGSVSGFAEVYKEGIPVAEKIYFGFVPQSFEMAGGDVIIPAAFVPNAGCGRVDIKFVGIGSATSGFFSSTESAPVELFDTRTGFVRPDPFGNASFSFVNAWTEAAWQSP